MSKTYGAHASMGVLIMSLASLPANAADKLAQIKAGKARETAMKDLPDTIDGLQATSAAELKGHCASLKKERDLAEKELADRMKASAIAEGAILDVAHVSVTQGAKGLALPTAKAASAGENRAAKQAVAESFAQRKMLACQLYALGEIQAARSKKKTAVTKDLVRGCFDAKTVPDLTDLKCEDDVPGAPPPKAKG